MNTVGSFDGEDGGNSKHSCVLSRRKKDFVNVEITSSCEAERSRNKTSMYAR